MIKHKFGCDLNAIPEESRRLLVVNQTVSFSSESAGFCHTISRGSRVFDTLQARLLQGVETLQLQGILYGSMHDRLGRYSDCSLIKFAGNAFHAWCCAASLFCTLLLLAELYDRKPRAPSETPKAAASDKETDSPGMPDDLESFWDQMWGIRQGRQGGS